MIELREIGTSDLHKIQHLAHATWPQAYGQFISKEQLNYMLDLIYNETALKNQWVEKGHHFLLAERDGQSLGFCSYELNYNRQPELMIHKLYLLPDAQGLGIGTRFIHYLMDTARMNNQGKLRLNVYFENIKAIRFYEKNGFIKTGSESKDIGHNYTILDHVMEKRVPPPLYSE